MSKLLSRQGVRDGLLGAALLCAMLALIVWPQESAQAVRDGLLLCYNVILPSLFPFFILSSLVVSLGLSGYLGRLLEPVMAPVFHVSGCCASALVLGFIGGYPVGARTAISLYESGACSRTETERMLAFCNNSGPAFILGVVGAGVFADSRVGVLLCLTHMAASLCVGVLFRFYKRGDLPRSGGRSTQIRAERFSTALVDAVTGSLRSTLSICAFVTLFTVVIRMLTTAGVFGLLSALLERLLGPLGLSTLWAQRLLTGALELSSGVWSLTGAGSLSGKLSMAAFMLGWAGVSVHCQVLTFIGGSGLSTRTYFWGKLLHGGLSALFTAVLARVVPLGASVSAVLATQVADIAGTDFHTALTVSTVAAWVLFLFFFLCAGTSLEMKRKT